MDTAFTCSLYCVAAVLLGASFVKDKKKTSKSLKRAWKMFVNMLSQFIAILLLVGLLLAVVTPETIQRIIGAESGFLGMLITSLLGAVALVPVLIAFPVAAVFPGWFPDRQFEPDSLCRYQLEAGSVQ